jgi:hypothetical protein
MRLSGIIPTKRLPYGRALQSSTLRQFGGGWNTLDDDMNMSPKFSTVLTNCYPTADGSMRVRYGYKEFADVSASLSSAVRIINIEYFADHIIAVLDTGVVVRISSGGSVVVIWDTGIAAALPGAPAAWGPTEFASFAKFNGDLIICNGSDKPIIVSPLLVVDYLQDLATGSNLNVPICHYVVPINRYLAMAGDALEPDRIHFSAKDASGTWYGDPPPNNATRIDIGSVLPGATTIRGLLPFRGKLIAMFDEGLVIGDVGEENSAGDHIPTFEDGIEGFGGVSHRAAVAFGDDGFFLDLEGVPSLKRTVFAGSFKPERASEVIHNDIGRAVKAMSSVARDLNTFAVFNKTDSQIMFFCPNSELLQNATESPAYVYTYRPTLRQNAWSYFNGWNFTCGVRSLGGTIFLGDKNGKIWHYGASQLLGTAYADAMIGLNGTPIVYEWTMPWFDFGHRANTKNSKYISFDTRGSAQFTVRMYVDNLLTQAVSKDDPTQIDAPALSSVFTAGEESGEGRVQANATGRNTSVKKKYAWPTKFEIAKLRITGSTTTALEFISLTMHYQLGGINR